MDDYEDMPIDQFGAAMLKGMGWKPGEAIGLNKKGFVVVHTHPFMYMYKVHNYTCIKYMYMYFNFMLHMYIY